MLCESGDDRSFDVSKKLQRLSQQSNGRASTLCIQTTSLANHYAIHLTNAISRSESPGDLITCFATARALLEEPPKTTTSSHPRRQRKFSASPAAPASHTEDLVKKAMPPYAAPNGSSQQSNGQRRQNRVAIPLPLSKPRPAKTQAKPEVDAAVEAPAKKELAEQASQNGHAEEVPVAEQTGAESNQDAPAPAVASQETSDVKRTSSAVEAPGSRGSAAMSLSNGATPEQSQDMARPPSPPQASVAPVNPQSPAAAPASSRKPAQIRTELPPAFIPSGGQRTPHSATSSLHINRNSQVFQPQAHNARPSTSSIVFGGEDSIASSPVPPQSAGSTYIPPPSQPVQRQSQQPHFAPANHAHHLSEPPAYPMYPPGYPPHQPQWSNQRQFYPSQHQPPFHPHHAHANFRYPPREPFVPAETPQPNGHAAASRSASPGSSTTADAQKPAQDLRSPAVAGSSNNAIFHGGFPGHHGIRPQSFSRNMPPQQSGNPDFRLDLDNAQILRDHVRSSFADPTLADCHLQITLEADNSRQFLDAHKLILSRSPTLLDLIRNSPNPASASLKTQVPIHLKGRYVGLRSFNECLRYIYGGPLLQFDTGLRHGSASANPNSVADERMEHALQHIAIGTWLKMPVIAIRGAEVAMSLLHWETIPAALGFGLEGGLSPTWTVDDGSEDRNSTVSSDDSLARNDVSAGPLYEPHSTGLLHAVFQYTLNMFPPNFYPDTSAPQLAASPRLPHISPTHEKSKASQSDPRLSQIRFGELPPAEAPRPSPVTTTISSLLFSLPFPLLKFLLEHPMLTDRLGPETVGSIIRQVVMERENRRLRAVKARSAAPIATAEATEPQLLSNMFWEETVEPFGQGRLGLRLARRRKGVDTPPSSAGGTET